MFLFFCHVTTMGPRGSTVFPIIKILVDCTLKRCIFICVNLELIWARRSPDFYARPYPYCNYEMVAMTTITRHFGFFLMEFKVSCHLFQIFIATFPVKEPFQKIGLKVGGYLKHRIRKRWNWTILKICQKLNHPQNMPDIKVATHL